MSSWLGELRHGRRLAALLSGHHRVPLVRTGLELGLFEALRSPLGAGELAARLGLEPDLVEAWLAAASACDLLLESDGCYRVGSFVCWLLDSPDTSALYAMLEQSERSYGPALARLSDLMKGGERPEFGSPEEAMRTAEASRLVERRAIETLGHVPGVHGARRVLDLGCGYGTYLARFLTHYRDAQGVGIELDAAVAEEARRVLREAEVSRRSEILVGDFMTMDVPDGSYDLVLLNNGLHYFSPAERVALLLRVRERLRPEGVLAVQTAVPRSGRLARWLGSAALIATFDLILRSHRNLHALPAPEELAARLRESGFAEVGEVAIMPDGTACYVWGRTPAESPEDSR